MTHTTPTHNQEQQRLLIWGDIRHLYKSCGGGSDGDWDNQDLKAYPAWQEMNRLIDIAAKHKWTMPEP